MQLLGSSSVPSAPNVQSPVRKHSASLLTGPSCVQFRSSSVLYMHGTCQIPIPYCVLPCVQSRSLVAVVKEENTVVIDRFIITMLQIETGSTPRPITLPLAQYTLASGHVCKAQGSKWTVLYSDSRVRECARQMRSIQRVYGRYTSLSEALDIHRFLVGSKYDTQLALQHYQRFVTFLDTFYHRLAPGSILSQDTHTQLSHYSVHNCNTLVGRDTAGRPIMVSQPGRIQVRAFLTRYRDHPTVLQERHTWFQESLRQQCAMYHQQQQPTYQIRVVLDLRNVRLGHLKLIPLLRRTTKLDAEMFPDTMYDVTIVNIPSFFSKVARLVSNFMDQDTLQKVHILTGSRDSCHNQMRARFPLKTSVLQTLLDLVKQ